MRTADRYIIRELLPPFALGVGGFLIILVGDILYTLADHIALGRVTPQILARVVVYKIPAILVLTFPISTLFAALLGLGRLVRDREIEALRLAGVPLSRVFAPVLAFGAAVAAATYLTNEVVAPWANREANAVVRRSLFGEAFPEVREQVFLRAPGNRFLYIHQVDDRARVLRSVMVYEAERVPPRLITARQADWSARTWVLRQGVARELDAEGYTVYEAAFASMELNVGLSHDVFFAAQRTPDEMTVKELRSQVHLFGAGLSPHVVLEYHRKFVVPTAAVIFALIAAPLSLLTARGGQAMSVGLSILLVFVYYVTMSLARALSGTGVLSPVLGAWAPNLLFLAVGGMMAVYEQGWLRGPVPPARPMRMKRAGS